MKIGVACLLSFSAIAVACPAVAAGDTGADFKLSAAYDGIASAYIITSAIKADPKGGDADSVVIGFKQRGESANLSGGLAILKKINSDWVVSWGGWFEGVFPKNVTANGPVLSMKLIRTTQAGEKSKDYSITYGKDFYYLYEPKNAFSTPKITASSTFKEAGVKAENVYDGDPATAWAEGVDGPGTGEWVDLSLKTPVGIGMVGVISGLFNLKDRVWKQNNRVQNGEIRVEITEEKRDEKSKLDFEKDLGMVISGDTIDMSFPNRPCVRFFEIRRNGVKSIRLVINSVFLGDQYDDTYMAEVIPFQIIDPSAPSQAAAATPPADEKKPDKSKEKQ
ncbi:MAG: hypothetical protein WC889_11640 [Myxococcota bacterium]|jgi:hypothetical protein